MKELGKSVLMIAFVFGSIFLWALPVWHFYHWFAMPIFDIPAINYLESAGLYVFSIFFKNNQPSKMKEKSTEEQAEHYLQATLMPLIVWGIGSLFYALFF